MSEEFLKEALNIKTEEEKINEAFSYLTEQEDDNKTIEQNTISEDEKKEEVKTEEKTEIKEKDETTEYLRKDEVEIMLKERDDKFNVLFNAHDKNKKESLESSLAEHKKDLAEAIDDEDQTKVDSILESITQTKISLMNLDRKPQEEKKSESTNRTLKEMMTEQEVKFVETAVYNLYPDMFEGDEGKEVEKRLASIHFRLCESIDNPQERIMLLNNAFKKEAEKFKPTPKAPNLDSGDTSREVVDAKKSGLTINDIPSGYVRKGKEEFGLTDKEIIESYEVDKATNFGIRRN